MEIQKSAQDYFRSLLETELEFLKSKNSRISLRSFAKRIGVGPGTLSEIINGKRKVSKAYAVKVASRLPLESHVVFELEKKFDEDTKLSSLDRHKGRKRTNLSMDQYNVVADPLYYSFLSLLETKDFRDENSWISRRLGTKVSEVIRIKKSLIDLNLAKYDGDKLVATNESLSTTDDIANDSLKTRHAKNLRDAEEALYMVDVLRREFSFITMAANTKKLKEAKKLIRQFKRQLCALLEDGNHDEVYELAINLYPRSFEDRSN